MKSNPRISVSNVRVRVALVFVGVSVAVALAGCAPAASTSVPSVGSSASPATAAGSAAGNTKEIDACSLLSAADASSLVGETLTTGVSSTIADGQDQCKYGSTGPDIGVNVIVYRDLSFSNVVAATGAMQSVGGVGVKAADDGTIELDVETADQRVIAVQYEQAAGRLAVAKALVTALK